MFYVTVKMGINTGYVSFDCADTINTAYVLCDCRGTINTAYVLCDCRDGNKYRICFV